MISKADYLAALDRHFHEAKRAFLLQIQTVGRRQFLAEAANRWDRAREKYGVHSDLNERNLLQDASQEAHDGIAYRAWHLTKRER